MYDNYEIYGKRQKEHTSNYQSTRHCVHSLYRISSNLQKIGLKMVFQLAPVIIIPIILYIVIVSPLEEQRESPEPISPSTDSDNRLIFFILFMIWFLFIIRIFYQFKKGKFKPPRRF